MGETAQIGNKVEDSKARAAEALKQGIKDGEKRSLTSSATETTGGAMPNVNLHFNNDLRPYSYTRALHGMHYGDWEAKSIERRMHEVLCERAGLNPDEKLREGTVLVPHSVSEGLDVSRAFNTYKADEAGALIRPGVGEVIDLLQSRLVLTEAGVQNITIPGGGFYWPREKTDVTGYWVDEEEAITESSLTLGKIELRPKKLAALMHVPKEALSDTTPSIDTFIRRSAARKLARQEEAAFFFGKGTSAVPRGLINDPDVAEVSSSFGDPTFEGLNTLRKALENAEGNPGNASFITFVNTKYALEDLRELIATATPQAGGQFLWSPVLSEASTPVYRGSRFLTTTNITGTAPQDVIFFGEWEECVMARTEALEVSVTDVFKFANDQVSFKFVERIDMGALQPALIKYVSGVTIP